MNKFKLAIYKPAVASFVLRISMKILVLSFLTYFIFRIHGFYAPGSTGIISQTIQTWFFEDVIPILKPYLGWIIFFAILILLDFVLNILYLFWVLSYRVTVGDNGAIVETDIFRTRQLLADEINGVEWSYLPDISNYFSLGGFLILLFRKKIGSAISKIPPRAGFAYGFSWGPILVNQKYSLFPRYAVTTDFLDAITKLRPDLKILIQPIETTLKGATKQRGFILRVIYFAFAGFALFIAITGGGLLFYGLAAFLIILGIFTGWYRK